VPSSSSWRACHARDRFPNALTALFAVVVLGLLSALVLSRKANLAWDDADYLRRGLLNARFAEESGPLLIAPRAIDRLLLEQPKPPWLVAWIELGVHMIGRRNIDALIIYSTVIPYALLVVSAILIGRRLGGPWGGFLALVCLACSPLSLAFGGKVMVETYLALWVLLAYGLTALYLTAPSRKKAAALGFVVGLAFLTKLTIVLFLPGPLIYGCVKALRSGADRWLLLKRLALSIAVCLAVAGPWYFRNARTAVKFAIFSAKYNEMATGRDRVPVSQRAAEMASDLAGWPLVVTTAGSAIAFALLRRKGQMARPGGNGGFAAGSAIADHLAKDRETVRNSGPYEEPVPGGQQRDMEHTFRQMAWLGAGIAAVAILYPTYFDTRFLLPIWPAIAVAVGTGVSLQFARLRAIARALIGVGFAVSLACAATAVAREQAFPTYWKTTGLIDDLVKRFGVSNLLNVGNCAGWNVCKTGLMNELRDEPASCFVLHDLTRATEARARYLLKQADAVIVLGRSDLSDAVLRVAPGLNRGYRDLVELLKNHSDFSAIPMPATDGLPELSVFVRRDRLEQAREMSKFETERRR
jgi:Dolichyl-phosphate-mannose-protein mannosyltransferase